MYSLVLFSTWIIWITIHLPFSSGKKEIISNNILVKGNLQFFQVSGLGDIWSFPTNGKNYVKTCGIGSFADFWFVTKYMNLPSSYADVIYVDVEAMLTADKCFNPGGSDVVPCFTSDFEVYIYRESTPAPERNTVVSLFNSHIYTIGNNSRSGITQSFSFSFSRNGTTGVSFGVRSRGACGKIFNMAIYYYFCEEKFSNSIRLVKTSAPLSGSKLVPANCSQHSLPLNASTGLQGNCKSNGTWDMNKDFKCLCMEGYEPNTTLGCSECPTDSFKPNVANTPCKKCPLRSRSINNRTSCQCKSGFYKSPPNCTQLSPCYAPLVLKEAPTIKYNKTVNILTVSWIEPSKTESLDEAIFYDVKCVICNEICNETCKNVVFNPRSYNLSDTLVAVTGLQPNKKYIFSVFPKNSLNEQISRNKWNFMKTNHFIFSSTIDEGDLGGSSDEKSKTPEMIGIAFGVTSFLLIIIVVVILVFRRRRSPAQKFQSCDGNSKNNEQNSSLEIETLHNRNIEAKYVDVLEDLEISPNDLKVLDEKLGAGQFGVVKQGLYTPQNGDPERVAVKMLKENAPESELLDLLAEIKVLKEANKEKHPNIIKFIGSCFLKGRLLMVTEFCPGGNLRKFLIKSRINDNSSDSHNIYVNITSTISDRQLLKLAVDVACGMVHLSSQKFLHRDLAARNILLGEENVAKICDFGLARDVGSAEEYIRNTQNLLPVKWMSLESLFDGVFTTASDVWSFGVLLYEIATLGEEPYKNIPARAVIIHVESGGRMSKPPHCSNEVYEIMSNCWKVDPKERPTFPEIFQALRDMLNDREHTYINVTQVKDGLQMAVQSAVRG